MINEVQGKWEAALPQEVKQMLDSSRNSIIGELVSTLAQKVTGGSGRKLNQDGLIGNVASTLAQTVTGGRWGFI